MFQRDYTLHMIMWTLTSPSIVAFDLDQFRGGLDGGLYCSLSSQKLWIRCQLWCRLAGDKNYFMAFPSIPPVSASWWHKRNLRKILHCLMHCPPLCKKKAVCSNHSCTTANPVVLLINTLLLSIHVINVSVLVCRGIFNQGYLCSKCGLGAHKECLGRIGCCGKTGNAPLLHTQI